MAYNVAHATYSDHNRGIQVAQNTSTIHVAAGKSNRSTAKISPANNSTQTAQPETLPSPLSTVPFPCNLDYINRGSLIDEIYEKLSVPAAQAALVRLGGVG